ncbi:MAG: cysteine desulfurase family protein [archaeon]
MKSIYLDNAATTRVDDSVIKEMNKYHSESYGNASSSHLMGKESKRAISEAREVIAKSIGARDDEIFFTSGGTEANNWALKGLFFANPGKRHIIVTKTEHDCVMESCRWLESQGAKITYLDVDKQGFVNPVDVERAITSNTLMVSIIHGNNEIGTIQDLGAIGEICRKKGVYFHTDACQSYTKTLLDVKKQNVDLVTLNAHKIHGPKGVGALYIRTGVKITPLFHGGGQESFFRSGTENVPGVMGFAKSVKIASSSDVKKMARLRDKFISDLLKIPNTKLNGPTGEKRLCNNINICFSNIDAEAIGDYLISYGICSSIGSACSSNTLEGMHKRSHVLEAIGLTEMEMKSSVRFSISKFTIEEELAYASKIIANIVEKLRKMSPLTK